MADCLACRKHTDAVFRVLEVQTLHIRDINGERRVQALGRFQDYAVCADCAAARLALIRQPVRAMARRCAAFGVILALGIILLAGFSADATLRMAGLAALVCGTVGLVGSAQAGRAKRREYDAMTGDLALHQAAWEVLVDQAPKKAQDSDLTYIPVDPETLSLQPEELMERFDLLPEIAKKAHVLLHGKTDKTA